MTLEEAITKYSSRVHNQSAAELKANPKFMKACRDIPEFKDWVLDRKPTMSTVRLPEVKFKPTPPIQAEPDKVQPAKTETPCVEREQVEVDAVLIEQFKKDYDLI